MSLPPSTSHRQLWLYVSLGGALLLLATLVISRTLGLAEIQRGAALVFDASERWPVLVFVGITLLHACGMALSLPTKGVLNLLAGALLGPLWGSVATLAGVLGGTTALFATVRGLLRHRFEARFGPWAAWLERRLHHRPVLVVAGLRLIVTLPYGPITIAAALAGVRYSAFLLGSLLGDLPVVVLYSFAGQRIAALASLREVLTPGTMVILGLAGLILLLCALAPHFAARRGLPFDEGSKKD